jgi:Acyl-CoA dehydrogenase, C-terminal domain
MTSAIHDDPEARPTVLHFGVPFKAEGVRILDTWRVMGMRGTGSHDVEFDGVFVPDAAISARREPGKWHPLFHMVFAIAFPMVYSAYVGVAEGARAKALAAARRKRDPRSVAAAAGALENAFAKAEMALDRMILLAETEPPGPARTSRTAIARTHAGQGAIESVERAMELVGGESFYRDLGLERAFRDVQGARFHPMREMPQWSSPAASHWASTSTPEATASRRGGSRAKPSGEARPAATATARPSSPPGCADTARRCSRPAGTGRPACSPGWKAPAAAAARASRPAPRA